MCLYVKCSPDFSASVFSAAVSSFVSFLEELEIAANREQRSMMLNGRGAPRATWFLTAAAGVSTLLCPPAARAFVQLPGAAFAPVSSPFSSLHQRPSLCARATHGYALTSDPVPAMQLSAWPCPPLR